MKIDTKTLTEMATELLFNRKLSIWMRRVRLNSQRCWVVQNERDEYLTAEIDFEHVVDRDRVIYTLDKAFSIASAYVLRESQREAVSE